MKKKKNIIPTLTIIIAVLGILTAIFITYKDEINNFIIERHNNNTVDLDKEKEIKNLNTLLEKIDSNLGWLAVISSFSTYNANGKYTISKNEDFLDNLVNRQIFVMEYILKDGNDKDFIVLDTEGNLLTDSPYPTDETCDSYYPYKLFNTQYKALFNQDFDVKNARKSVSLNNYDNNKDYVYYVNLRAGANGLYVKSMETTDVNYDHNKKYVANIKITYSPRLTTGLGYNEDIGIITYDYNKNNEIYLKSFMIKSQ